MRRGHYTPWTVDRNLGAAMGVRLEVALATLVFVALVATTSGCRTTCMADDEASQDQIAR